MEVRQADGGYVTFGREKVDVGNNTINRVADGIVDTDAVNVRQLNQLRNSITGNAGKQTTVTAGPNITVIQSTTHTPQGMPDAPTFNVSLNPDIAVNSANFSNSDTILETNITATGVSVTDPNGPNSIMSSNGFGVSEGNRYASMQQNFIHFGDTSKSESAHYSLKGVYLADNDSDPINITKENISFGNRQLHDVAEGVSDTDAVNVKQLKDVASSVANTVSGSGAVVVTSSTNSNGSTNYNVALNPDGIREIAKTSNRYAGDDVIKVNRWSNPTGSADLTTFKFDGNEAAKVVPITYKANGENAQTTTASKGLNFVDGNHINASVDNNGVVKFDLDKSVTDRIDSNANSIKANADAIKKITAANTANLGGLTDKVNMLSSKVDENQREARRGIASASALASLHPLDYDPTHKVDVMAGIGHYRGTTAVALGAAYRPNENMMFTIGASINGKDSTINAGVSYKVGTKEGVESKYSKVAMQRHIDELNTTVAEQNEKIEQLNNLVEKLLEEVHQAK